MDQSFTPYRTAQRPIVKSVNYGAFIPVGTWLQWNRFYFHLLYILLQCMSLEGTECCVLFQSTLFSLFIRVQADFLFPKNIFLDLDWAVLKIFCFVFLIRVCFDPNCLTLSPLKIQTRLEELHRLWDLLLQKTKEKGVRLLQAQKLVQYLRECEDALDWISDKVRNLSRYHLLRCINVWSTLKNNFT